MSSALARFRRWRSWLVLAALVPLLFGCATTPLAPSAVHYAFVVLAEEGRPVARAITTGATCPAIVLDGIAQPMGVRAKPGEFPGRALLGSPDDGKPYVFPVLTCEQAIPSGTARAVIEGRALPLPRPNPRRIIVIGDTGCRMSSIGNVYQACNDPKAWPFRIVADAVASAAPDLVIHVGDYHYREGPCPAGNTGCAGSPWGYGWDVWDADFFAPAQALFAAAPLVLVRGNHESCSRAGQGWWRFLDPRPLVPHQDCIDPADDTIGDYSEPYAIPLGRGADADTQLIVFDSSLVGLTPLKPTDLMYSNYYGELERAFVASARRPKNFFLAHHPLLGFAPNPADAQAPFKGNAGLQSVLQALNPDVLFPSWVQVVLSGHVHILELVSFSSPQPPQIVSGNSGVALDPHFPSPFPTKLMPAPGAVIEALTSTSTFGYLVMERDGERWNMFARDPYGTLMTTCTLVARKLACKPSGVL